MIKPEGTENVKSKMAASKLKVSVTQPERRTATEFQLLYPCFWAIAIDTAEPWRAACGETSFIGQLNPINMGTCSNWNSVAIYRSG